MGRPKLFQNRRFWLCSGLQNAVCSVKSSLGVSCPTGGGPRHQWPERMCFRGDCLISSEIPRPSLDTPSLKRQGDRSQGEDAGFARWPKAEYCHLIDRREVCTSQKTLASESVMSFHARYNIVDGSVWRRSSRLMTLEDRPGCLPRNHYDKWCFVIIFIQVFSSRVTFWGRFGADCNKIGARVHLFILETYFDQRSYLSFALHFTLHSFFQLSGIRAAQYSSRIRFMASDNFYLSHPSRTIFRVSLKWP